MADFAGTSHCRRVCSPPKSRPSCQMVYFGLLGLFLDQLTMRSISLPRRLTRAPPPRQVQIHTIQLLPGHLHYLRTLHCKLSQLKIPLLQRWKKNKPDHPTNVLPRSFPFSRLLSHSLFLRISICIMPYFDLYPITILTYVYVSLVIQRSASVTLLLYYGSSFSAGCLYGPFR
jgi:hypothetical protein